MTGLDFTLLQWILLVLCGVFVGMSKVGVPGVSMIVVPILAIIFGGKASTGILLPMLMMADLFGVGYYHRHAEWKYLWKLLPWAFVGIGIARWVGDWVIPVRRWGSGMALPLAAIPQRQRAELSRAM